MAITAMGLGSKSLSGDYNLDPQDQFWSWLHGMAKDHSKGTIFSGFKVEPTDPAGMSVQVGGHALTPDSAVYYGDGADGNFFSRHNVLLSSDGVPTKVELSGANKSGYTIYYIVSYVMPASSVAASSQTAGTPELVKTMAVTGASYGAPTASEIEAAKASGAEPGYIIWGQVVLSGETTTVTSSNITQANDMSSGNMRTTRGLLYDDSLALKGNSAASSVQFSQNGATITTISMPAGRVRFGMFFCNVMLTSGNSNYYYPRVSLDGVGAQASFQLSAATGQVSVCIPFSTTDTSKTSIRVRGWNTTEARTFEQMSWWCVGIN